MERTKMIEEAVKRMRILKLCDGAEDSIVRQLEEEGKIYKSVSHVLVEETKAEELYALTEAEEKLVRDFEKKSGYLVYYMMRNEAINSDPPIGVEVQYELFFVSDKENEWEQDRKDITGTEPYIMLWYDVLAK